MMPWWYGGAPGPGLFPFDGWMGHVLVMVLFWAGVVALAVMAVRRVTLPARGAAENGPDEAGILSAMTILQERYARGEIGREEFMQKQRDLTVPPYRDEAAA